MRRLDTGSGYYFENLISKCVSATSIIALVATRAGDKKKTLLYKGLYKQVKTATNHFKSDHVMYS